MKTVTLGEILNILSISLRGAKAEEEGRFALLIEDASSGRSFQLEFIPETGEARSNRGSNLRSVQVRCRDTASGKIFYHLELNSLTGPVFVNWESKESVVLVHSDGSRFYLLAVSNSLGAQMSTGKEKRKGANPFSRDDGSEESNKRKRYSMIVS